MSRTWRGQCSCGCWPGWGVESPHTYVSYPLTMYCSSREQIRKPTSAMSKPSSIGYANYTNVQTQILICIHTYIHIHNYIHTQILICIHTYIHIHNYIHTQILICIHTYINTIHSLKLKYTYINTYSRIIFTYIHIHTYTYIHTHTYIQRNLYACKHTCT